MRVNFIFCLTWTESFPWATAGKYVSSCVLFSTALITHLTFRMMARTWYFGQTHPGTSSRALTGPGDNASHYPHLPQQEAFFPPHRWFRNLDDVHKHRNDRVSVSFRNFGHPSFDVCGHDNKPALPMTHAWRHMDAWGTNTTDDRHPIDRRWF